MKDKLESFFELLEKDQNTQDDFIMHIKAFIEKTVEPEEEKKEDCRYTTEDLWIVKRKYYTNTVDCIINDHDEGCVMTCGVVKIPKGTKVTWCNKRNKWHTDEYGGISFIYQCTFFSRNNPFSPK